jgi:uncharacterized protein with GYD domain
MGYSGQPEASAPSGKPAIKAGLLRKQSDCPGAKWLDSDVTMGRFDAIDLVESDDPMQVAKAVSIISAYGHAMTETLQATPWKEYVAAL